MRLGDQMNGNRGWYPVLYENPVLDENPVGPPASPDPAGMDSSETGVGIPVIVAAIMSVRS